MALFPNLNINDPVWRELFRNADFRRALSVAINRDDINNAIFYGLAMPSQQYGAAGIAALQGRVPDEVDAVRSRPRQPAARRARADQARRRRHPAAARRPADADRRRDGRRGDRADRRAGADPRRLAARSASRSSSSRRSARCSTTASRPATTQMAVWWGLENALLKAVDKPGRVRAAHLRTSSSGRPGASGRRPAARWARSRTSTRSSELMALKEEWGEAADPARAARRSGTRCCRSGPTRCSPSASSPASSSSSSSANKLRNVPERGIYNFDPGAYFGMYRPDTFWFAESTEQVAAESP